MREKILTDLKILSIVGPGNSEYKNCQELITLYNKLLESKDLEATVLNMYNDAVVMIKGLEYFQKIDKDYNKDLYLEKKKIYEALRFII